MNIFRAILFIAIGFVSHPTTAVESTYTAAILGGSFDADLGRPLSLSQPMGLYLRSSLSEAGISATPYAFGGASLEGLEKQYQQYRTDVVYVGHAADLVYLGLTGEALSRPSEFLEWAQKVTKELLEEGTIVVVSSYPRTGCFSQEVLSDLDFSANWNEMVSAYETFMQLAGAIVVRPFERMVPLTYRTNNDGDPSQYYDGFHPDNGSARAAAYVVSAAMISALNQRD